MTARVERADTRSETEISAALAARWEARGGIVVRVQSGRVKVRGGWMHLADPGTPDRFIIGPGFSFWAETKTRKGELNTAQISWHHKARKLGQLVFLVRDEAAADWAWFTAQGAQGVSNG